jgi:hypothetical protein
MLEKLLNWTPSHLDVFYTTIAQCDWAPRSQIEKLVGTIEWHSLSPDSNVTLLRLPSIHRPSLLNYFSHSRPSEQTHRTRNEG